jgi:hypothetical protein
MYHLLFCVVAAEDGYSMSTHLGTLFLLAVVAAFGVFRENPLVVVLRLGAAIGVVLPLGYFYVHGTIATGDIVVAAILGFRLGLWGGITAVGIGTALTLLATSLIGGYPGTTPPIDRVPAIPGFLCGELIVGGFGTL